METIGTQGIQFIIQIILARLLLPEDFGNIALVTVFILLGNVFIQSGFNTALIQKKEADSLDFSSVFYLSLVFASFLYIIIFFSSPMIANFYQQPDITLILRVLSVVLFLGAFNSVQNAYIAKNMMFKKLFFSSLVAISISGSAGIIAAYLGFGIWALVLQQVLNQLLITVILWVTVKWRPSLAFSFKRTKILFLFGWKILASSLLNSLYVNLRTLLIGKIYSPDILGHYNRGSQFPLLIINSINGSIQSVMLPALSSYQDNTLKVKEMIKRAVMTSSFVIFPLMIGLAVIADPLINIVLTEKWAPAVPFLQIYCLIYALRPLHTANAQAANALGRSDIFLRVEIIRTIIGLIILILSLPFGVFGIAWGALLHAVISTYIYIFPNTGLINYSFKSQMKDIIPALIISILMGALIYPINFLNVPQIATLLLQIIFGALIYILLAMIFKIKSFNYLIVTIREIFNPKRTV